jgi:hypothetical protein
MRFLPLIMPSDFIQFLNSARKFYTKNLTERWGSMGARAWPKGGAAVPHARRQGGRLEALEAVTCHRDAPGRCQRGQSTTKAASRWWRGVDMASPVSCAEVEGERMEVAKEIWAPSRC